MPHRNWEATAFTADHPEAPPPKRAKPAARLTLSRTKPVSVLPWGKRRRCLGKTTPVDSEEQWKTIFRRLESLVPRVGKTEITDPEILSQIQDLVSDKEVIHVRGCRGSSRTIAPPETLIRGEAPWRRAIFTERGSGNIKAEEEWEMWETLAKRNLIRPSHPSRLNITVFARTSPVSHAGTSVPRGDSHVEVPPNPDAVPEVTGTQTEMPGSSDQNASHHTSLTPSQEHDMQNPKQSERFQETFKGRTTDDSSCS